MQNDESIEGFNTAVFIRLLRYLKPQIHLIVIALIGLFFSVFFEIRAPVIIKQAIDDHLLNHVYLLPGDYSDITLINAIQGDGDVFASQQEIATLSSDVAKKITEEAGQYILFPLTQDTLKIAKKYPGVLKLYSETNKTPFGSLPVDRIDELKSEEVRILRADDFMGLKNKSLELFLCLAAGFFFSFLQVFVMAFTVQKLMKAIRSEVMSHILTQSLDFHNNTPVGRLVSRLTSDVETLNEFFTQVSAQMIRNIALFTGAVITMLRLDLRMALISFTILIPVFGVLVIFRRQARGAFREVRRWVSEVNVYLSEHFMGTEVVKTFRTEEVCDNEFGERSSQLFKANMRQVFVDAFFFPIIQMLTSVAVAAVIIGGGFLASNGWFATGVLVAFITLVQKMFMPLIDFAQKFTVMQSALAGGERVFTLLDEKKVIEDSGKKVPAGIRGDIAFQNVTFGYKENRPVIKDLTFDIKAGETVAIVGYTGSGKTTIANLLVRFWERNSGSILLDGTDIREYPLSTLRRMVRAVPQDPFIFTGSVLENITLGLPIPREQVEEGAQLTMAHNFISKLPQEYDTVMKERGSSLSAGQKQLIAFARVMTHNPRVVILDEATANIDSETEEFIQKGLDAVLAARTSIIIAHRLSTIRRADKIMVINDGAIVESGTHKDLLELNGVYASLYNLQFNEES